MVIIKYFCGNYDMKMKRIVRKYYVFYLIHVVSDNK